MSAAEKATGAAEKATEIVTDIAADAAAEVAQQAKQTEKLHSLAAQGQGKDGLIGFTVGTVVGAAAAVAIVYRRAETKYSKIADVRDRRDAPALPGQDHGGRSRRLRSWRRSRKSCVERGYKCL